MPGLLEELLLFEIDVVVTPSEDTTLVLPFRPVADTLPLLP